MTITSEQIVTLASVVGAVVGLWAIFSKPFTTLKRIDQRTSKMAKQVKLADLAHNTDESRIAGLNEARRKKYEMAKQILLG